MAESKSYGLSAAFERQIAQLACTNRNFWYKIGEHIDPDRIADRTHQLIISACKAVAVDNGRAPDMPSVVLQRVQRWQDDGKVSYEEYEEAEILVSDAMAEGSEIDDEAIVKELIPIIRRQKEREALQTGLDSYGKNKSLGSVSQLLEKAYRIGIVDSAPGLALNAGAVDKVVELKNLVRLGTGIPELDAELGGGMPRACLGVVLGPAKSGKSMSLCHIACNALVNGLRVAYASLEIADVHVMARIIANLTDLSSAAIIDDLTAGDARTRLKFLEEKGLLPYCTVKYFPPDITSTKDIREWVDREEQALGVEIPVVLTDYVQLIGVQEGAKNMASHEKKKVVAQDHRSWAIDKNKWIWTAAQPQRKKDSGANKKTRIGLDDVADGMYITRTCDLAISINPQEEGMVYHVAGFRHGSGTGSDVGPFKTYFDYGRVTHVERPNWPFYSQEEGAF